MGSGTPPSLGSQVYSYAYNRIGQQVGSGECYDLADQALTAAGARSAASYGKITRNADYRWGAAVNLKKVEQGDVLQFRNFTVTVKTTTVTTTKRRNGSSEEKTSVVTQSQSRPHHTAIVSAKREGGETLILEQNVVPMGEKQADRTVRENRLFTEPHKTASKKVEQRADAVVTTEIKTVISVKGTIWAYRPQPQ